MSDRGRREALLGFALGVALGFGGIALSRGGPAGGSTPIAEAPDPATEEIAAIRLEIAGLRASARTPAADPPPSPPPTPDPVAELERQIAEAEARLGPFEGMDPIAVASHAAMPLRDRLRLYGRLPEKDRWKAAHAIGWALGSDPARAAEVLAALRTEADTALLRLLADVVRGGGLGERTPEVWAAVLALVRAGQPAERRIAAAAAMRPQLGADLPEAYFPVLEETLRLETDPSVLTVLGERLRGNNLAFVAVPPSVRDALALAAIRMPDGDGRRHLFSTLGDVSAHTPGDSAADTLFRLWTDARTPDLRDAIADALATSASSRGGFGHEGEPTAEALTARIERRRRFLAMYAATGDLRVRRRLLRASHRGLEVLSVMANGDDASAWLREVAAVEPDAAQRARLLDAAARIGSHEMRGSTALDTLLTGER